MIGGTYVAELSLLEQTVCVQVFVNRVGKKVHYSVGFRGLVMDLLNGPDWNISSCCCLQARDSSP